MHILIPLIFFLLVLYVPNYWAKSTLLRHSKPREDIPGTGKELAVHLLENFGMREVRVEETELGDHYDPLTKTVRLSVDNMHGKSLTAVATAAHEVGHAVQDHTGYRPLEWRTRLVLISQKMEKFGSLIILATPFLTLLSRAPALGLLTFLGGLCALGGPSLVHLVTLPVELDASFKKALPILQQGEYIGKNDQKVVRSILTACSFTYVASSLAGLLNLWRWLAILRR